MDHTQNLDDEKVEHFLEPVKALQSLLETYDQKGVIVGGVAASLLGNPRFTADIDAVFLLGFDDLPTFLEEAEKHGIHPRIPDVIEFARRSRVVLLRHVASGIDIDLSLGILPFEVEMIERSNLVKIGPLKIRLPTPEDLIIMKAIARRPKDLADILAVSASHPNLDRTRIRYWVEQFGEALEIPDLWEEISALF
jgi:hypothetical protein